MRVAVLGTGTVGSTIGGKLTSIGHEVCMGSRTRASDRAAAWVRDAGVNASQGTFSDAAEFGEVVINCTAGATSLASLEQAGSANLAGKVLIDLANPLDFSRGTPPTLTIANEDSLGERIQRAFPEARVVKTLNTVNHVVMVDPSVVPGRHNLFVSGDDAGAKAQVVEWLDAWFGWPPDDVIDLGDITTARGVEMVMPLWIRLWSALGTAYFNYSIVRGEAPQG